MPLSPRQSDFVAQHNYRRASGNASCAQCAHCEPGASSAWCVQRQDRVNLIKVCNIFLSRSVYGYMQNEL
jgi:hypothetical protein